MKEVIMGAPFAASIQVVLDKTSDDQLCISISHIQSYSPRGIKDRKTHRYRLLGSIHLSKKQIKEILEED